MESQVSSSLHDSSEELGSVHMRVALRRHAVVIEGKAEGDPDEDADGLIDGDLDATAPLGSYDVILVGSPLGLGDGTELRKLGGLFRGLAEGFPLGAADGEGDGAIDGVFDGSSDSDPDGVLLGFSEAILVGQELGLGEGTLLRAAEGRFEGLADGTGLGASDPMMS